MQPITARFVWTFEELTAAIRLHWHHQLRSWLRLVVYGFALLIAIGLALGAITGATGDRIVCGIVLFGVLATIFIWAIMSRFSRRNQFNRSPFKEREIQWQFGPGNIRVATDLSKSEFAWDVLIKVVRGKDGLLFYLSDQVFHWIPRHAFEDDASFEKVTELSKEMVKRLYYVN